MNSFYKFIKRFSEFFIDKCLYCAVFDRIFLSEKMANKEILPIETSSLFEIVDFFKDYDDKRHLRVYNCLLKEILKICHHSDEKKIAELIQLEKDWRSFSKLNQVGDRDLSLYLLALELSKLTYKKVIIITDDIPFFYFTRAINKKDNIMLGRRTYKTSNVTSVSALLYIYTLYSCCRFDDFQGFYKFYGSYMDQLVKEKIIDLSKDMIIETSKFFLKSNRYKEELQCGDI